MNLAKNQIIILAVGVSVFLILILILTGALPSLKQTSNRILTAALNFNQQPLFNNTDNFVLFAEKEIKLEKDTQVSSGDLGSNGKINIQKDNIINGNLFAKEITIDKDIQINGNASYNKLKLHKDSRILGVTSSPVSLPVTELPEIPDFQIGSQDFKFAGQNNVLNPGSYRNILMEKDSRLTLTGGTYNLNKLELKENSKLLYSASTTINIKQAVSISRRVLIAPNNNGISSTDLTVNIKPQTKPAASVFQNFLNNLLSRLKKPQPKTIPRTFVFGERSFISAKLIAPDSWIILGKETTFRGQALAREIKVGRGTVLSLDIATTREPRIENIVRTEAGGAFVINEILVSFIPEATLDDVIIVVSSAGGRIIGVVPSINLYQIEVPINAAADLDNLIINLELQSNPKIISISKNHILNPF